MTSSMWRVNQILFWLGLSVVVACPDSAPQSWPCNRDVDCETGEICQEGLCVLGTRITDANIAGMDRSTDLGFGEDSSSDTTSTDSAHDVLTGEDISSRDASTDAVIIDAAGPSDIQTEDGSSPDRQVTDIVVDRQNPDSVILDIFAQDALPLRDMYLPDQTQLDLDKDTLVPDMSGILDIGMPDLMNTDTSTIRTEVWGDIPQSTYPGTIQDTYINLDTEKNSASTTLKLYTWPAQSRANAIIIKWDLSVLPASTVVLEAVVGLSVRERSAAPYTSTVHAITNVTPNIMHCTGYNYDNVHTWTASDCCYDGIPLAQGDIGAAESQVVIDGSDSQWLWDVTEMVRNWVSSPPSNRGMLINADPAAASEDHVFFYSSEAPELELRPWLGIVYMPRG